jgi:hypothetical protein
MEKGHRIDGNLQPHYHLIDLARVLDTSTHSARSLGGYPISVW